jgi:hypothetical protein
MGNASSFQQASEEIIKALTPDAYYFNITLLK